MQMMRRTQADRSAETRAALIGAARSLFAEHGFAGVGTEAIVSAAHVSRGALYHHFGDKTELFAAVMVEVEADVTARIASSAEGVGELGFKPVMLAAVTTWLDVCEAPEMQRILLLDGPSVLGWTRWRELLQPYALSLVEALVNHAIDEGAIRAVPARPLAHVLVAVADEAAMFVASSDDKPAARGEMLEVFDQLLGSLAIQAG
jgi:AcrR family transcriptional regulator